MSIEFDLNGSFRE